MRNSIDEIISNAIKASQDSIKVSRASLSKIDSINPSLAKDVNSMLNAFSSGGKITAETLAKSIVSKANELLKEDQNADSIK